ncbi:hypothetical protein [Actinomadura sp. 6N118]|uniref:P-type ATPase n=1 Tax=Actinomadura sp. 6N118 TaxID=3375151 RepID=UPI003792FE29
MQLSRLLGTAAQIVRVLPAPATVRDVVSAAAGSRAERVGPGRVHIKVRGLHTAEAVPMARALETVLSGIEAVSAVEANAVLGRLVVTHDPEVAVDELIAEVAAAVEEAERLHGFDRAHFAPAMPGEATLIAREAAWIGTAVAGCGVAVAGRMVRAVPLPPGVPALLALADVTPWIRAGVERGVGAPAADLIFSGGGALTQALAQQPTGLALDAVHRVTRLAEWRAHREAWSRAERGQERATGVHRTDPLERPARPVPLPPGPIEQLLRLSPVSLAASLGALAISRNARQAQGVLVSGVPRAARLGREVFAARFGKAAAGRGVVVCDAGALRRLDRVDAVVIDASALRTGRLMIEEVVPVSDAVVAQECHERAHELVDLARPGRSRRVGEWMVLPFGSWRPRVGRVVRERADDLHRQGTTVLALARGGELLALVSLVPEPHPLGEALVSAAHRTGLVVVAGVGGRADLRLPVDRRVAGGRWLQTSVRRLQEEGYGVALISARGAAALAAADVGVGLVSPGDRPPWGAHLLCGRDLEAAWMIVDAMAVARQVSMRSARIAAVGATAGLMLAAASTAPQAPRRALMAVNAASLCALATGAYAGQAVTRRPSPVPADRTPWHAWPVQAVLDHLDSSLSGIDEAQAAQRRTGDQRAEETPAGLARATLEELDNPLTPPLAAGAGISAVVGSVMDAALIATVLGVNAFMSGAQRIGADRAVRGLVRLSSVPIRLRRPETGAETGAEAGGEVEVTADELVPGDVIALAAGDAVPADCRVLSAEGLEVDESSLTGESQLVAKQARPSVARAVADRRSMLYQGTVVAAGNAVAAVVATGQRTEIGRTARLVLEERRPGGVEMRLMALTRATLPASLAAGAVLMGMDLLAGRTFGQALGSAVSLAVAAVPEGLPFRGDRGGTGHSPPPVPPPRPGAQPVDGRGARPGRCAVLRQDRHADRGATAGAPGLRRDDDAAHQGPVPLAA